jgi:hypothetical protein
MSATRHFPVTRAKRAAGAFVYLSYCRAGARLGMVFANETCLAEESEVLTGRQQLARLLPLALLLILAIAGLRGRTAALGWDGPLRSGGVVIGLVLEVVLGVLLVITLVRDAAARRAAEAASRVAQAAGDGPDVPAALRWVLKWVLGAGMAAVAVALLLGLHLRAFTAPPRKLPLVRPAAPAKRPNSGGTVGPPFHFPLEAILYGLLIAALVAAIAISIWWSARLRRPVTVGLTDDLVVDSEQLRDAVEEGRAALAELDDAREAIIACYVAMERSLAERGAARNAADTPDELLARAVTSRVVRGPAAQRLTGLFYEARFSSHPLGPEQRDAARQALDDLAAELAAAAEPVP